MAMGIENLHHPGKRLVNGVAIAGGDVIRKRESRRIVLREVQDALAAEDFGQIIDHKPVV